MSDDLSGGLPADPSGSDDPPPGERRGRLTRRGRAVVGVFAVLLVVGLGAGL